jgi:hypothetical protein
LLQFVVSYRTPRDYISLGKTYHFVQAQVCNLELTEKLKLQLLLLHFPTHLSFSMTLPFLHYLPSTHGVVSFVFWLLTELIPLGQ